MISVSGLMRLFGGFPLLYIFFASLYACMCVCVSVCVCGCVWWCGERKPKRRRRDMDKNKARCVAVLPLEGFDGLFPSALL